MRTYHFLFIGLFCLMSNVFAIDLSKSVSYGGLTVNYPSKGYQVRDKSSSSMYYFVMDNNNAKGGDYALAQFRYGNNRIEDHSDDMHVFCNERLEVLKSSFENNALYKNFSSEENYIEDHDSYSLGITAFTGTIYGTKVYGRSIVAVTSASLFILILQGTQEEYIKDFEEISKTVHMTQIPELSITDQYQKFYAFVQQNKDSKEKVTAPSHSEAPYQPVLTHNSMVDKNIPQNNVSNDKTFVIIIANEKYQEESSVQYAMNDGEIFQKYCENTLGIPARNIHYHPNATLNNIRKEISWLDQVCQAYEGQANVILYYAGHGIPDEASKAAYLLPVDGTGSDIATGYKLDDLYATLGKMPAAHVTVFMDACFSGSKREAGMLASARGVALKAKAGLPQGNMVVFSAAQGDETAYPNKDEEHGMFTYYLLKKLQDTKGDVTLSDLGNYITTNVRQQSIVINGKSQTPSVTASSALGTDWQNWKLK